MRCRVFEKITPVLEYVKHFSSDQAHHQCNDGNFSHPVVWPDTNHSFFRFFELGLSFFPPFQAGKQGSENQSRWQVAHTGKYISLRILCMFRTQEKQGNNLIAQDKSKDEVQCQFSKTCRLTHSDLHFSWMEQSLPAFPP